MREKNKAWSTGHTVVFFVTFFFLSVQEHVLMSRYGVSKHTLVEALLWFSLLFGRSGPGGSGIWIWIIELGILWS